MAVRSWTVLAHVAACVASLAVLLLFPAARVHSFSIHFRAPEVCRSAQRHLPIAQTEADSIKCVAQTAPLPVFSARTETVHVSSTSLPQEFVVEIPLVRLVNRMKLSPPGSGAQDPFLKA